MKAGSPSSTVTPYEEISREDWARLSQQTPLPLSEEDVTRLRGLGDRQRRALLERFDFTVD